MNTLEEFTRQTLSSLTGVIWVCHPTAAAGTWCSGISGTSVCQRISGFIPKGRTQSWGALKDPPSGVNSHWALVVLGPTA